MVSFRKNNGSYLQHQLRRLQDLQTEIYRQLQLLIPDEIAHYDSFLSRVHGSPLLRMDVLERHPFTHFMRLTYQFDKTVPPEIAPDAHIRIYNDARLAEVTSFDPEQGFKRQAPGKGSPLDLLGVNLDNSGIEGHTDGTPAVTLFTPSQIFQRSWRKNQALDKWLGYLLHQGHSLTSMRPASDKISGKQPIPVKHPVHSA
jgi:uncharacterized protein YqiB (DUF1249 family)